MTHAHWYWILSLALAGLAAVCLVFRFPGQRWLRPIAVTAGGAIVSLCFGDGSALMPILLTGAILTVCSVAAART